jgi:hypothetical protein
MSAGHESQPSSEPDFAARYTAVVTCPAWCAEPAGHPYREVGSEGLQRFHRTTAGDLDRWGLRLTLDQQEYGASAVGPIESAPAYSYLTVPVPGDLAYVTSSDLRALGVAITAAADQLDAFIPTKRQRTPEQDVTA